MRNHATPRRNFPHARGGWGEFSNLSRKLLRFRWVEAASNGRRANHFVAPAFGWLFLACDATENSKRNTGDQIGLEGLPLILSASPLPGIHRIFTWSPR